MRLNTILYSLLVMSMVVEAGRAVPVADGQPETLEGALQRHHIALTKDALVEALRNPDAEARRLAAQKLAKDGVKDSIPSIADALKSEALPLNQVNLAFSLAELGDSAGIAKLKAMCNSAAIAGGIRMLAAQYALWLHDDGCGSAILIALQSDEDAETRIQALSLIPSLRNASTHPSASLALIAKALADQSPGVRLAASSTLGTIGDASAIPYLQKALATEQNEGCALEMRMDLQQLQKRGSH